MSKLRERVWQLCGFEFYQIRINIDTTVKTVYGNQQGARKGHNTKRPLKNWLDFRFYDFVNFFEQRRLNYNHLLFK
jgi:hypothetical protein